MSKRRLIKKSTTVDSSQNTPEQLNVNDLVYWTYDPIDAHPGIIIEKKHVSNVWYPSSPKRTIYTVLWPGDNGNHHDISEHNSAELVRMNEWKYISKCWIPKK